MFAVPGWSVSSTSLKTQTEGGSSTSLNHPKSSIGKPSIQLPKSSKKRKRSGTASKDVIVNPENFANLWESVIEGKSKGDGKSRTQPGQTGPSNKTIQKQLIDAEPQKATDKTFSPNDQRDQPGGRELSKRKRSKKRQKNLQDADQLAPVTKPLSNHPSKPSAPDSTSKKLTPLQTSMRQKLAAARFRHLNETLYTTPSSNALSLFRDNPEMFVDYHRGFRLQVDKWPENPVNGYLAAIRQRGKVLSDGRQRRAGKKLNKSDTSLSPLPRTGELCVIADLGCGDGQLAQTLDPEKGRLNIKILSYDLQSPNKFVTEADISKLPLKDGSVDVAIFCLALMGTNWVDFVEEAFRVLHWKGELWIAEIKSRFSRSSTSKRLEHSVGNRTKPGIGPKSTTYDSEAIDDRIQTIATNDQARDKKDTDVSAFVEVLRKRGFALQNEDAIDLNNKMFVKLNFVKALSPTKGKCVPERGVQNSTVGRMKTKIKFPESNTGINEVEEASVLKPCVYKSR